jgi:hypothetical protein
MILAEANIAVAKAIKEALSKLSEQNLRTILCAGKFCYLRFRTGI